VTADVSKIVLLDVASGRGIEAELRDAVEEAQLVDWQTRWQPALMSVLQELARRGVPIADWPQSWHWNWREKTAQVKGLLAYRGFSVVCASLTQGLMSVNLNKLAWIPAQKGKPLVYVDYLEVAPWNRPDLGQTVRYRGVGTALLVAAAALSLEEGFSGRIGLHSLPQADGFYRDRCGMTDLGPDADYQNLRYFEMAPDQATAFLEEESGHEV
jgi:hypothetical protein